MATPQELKDLHANDELKVKTEMAVVEIMVDILKNEDTDANGYDDDATNKANRLWWVGYSRNNKAQEAKNLLWYVLAANSSQTVANIISADVANIKNNLKAILIRYCNGLKASIVP